MKTKVIPTARLNPAQSLKTYRKIMSAHTATPNARHFTGLRDRELQCLTPKRDFHSCEDQLLVRNFSYPCLNIVVQPLAKGLHAAFQVIAVCHFLLGECEGAEVGELVARGKQKTCSLPGEYFRGVFPRYMLCPCG